MVLLPLAAFAAGLSLAQLFALTLGQGSSPARATSPGPGLLATWAAVLTAAYIAPRGHRASAVVVWGLVCTLTLMLNVGRLIEGQIPSVFNVTLAGSVLGGALGCLIF